MAQSYRIQPEKDYPLIADWRTSTPPLLYVSLTFARTIPLMNCLLASATTKEISFLLDHYRTGEGSADIDILITGIGLTAATYSLSKQLSIKKPGCIIQAGIAGCFDKNISLGSVVIVKQDTIADLGVIENKQFSSMFDLGLTKLNQPPYSNGWLINPHKKILDKSTLQKVKAISVNQITTSKQLIGYYREKFQPAIESMEGAALHYTCLMENIPFIQIRSISNYVGERNKEKWDMKQAINNLNKELIGFVNNLKPLNP